MMPWATPSCRNRSDAWWTISRRCTTKMADFNSDEYRFIMLAATEVLPPPVGITANTQRCGSLSIASTYSIW